MGFHLTTCPYCSFGCGLLLQEADDRLIGTHPSSAHPVSRGSLCVRGWNSTDAQRHADRLTTPLVRSGDAQLPVSPAEAVGQLADRLRPLAAGHGRATPSGRPALVVVGPTLANEDALAVKRLAQLLGARVCPAELSGVTTARRALATVFGRRHVAATLDDVAEADLLWVFGADPHESPHFASRLIHAERRGAAVVQFDVFARPPTGSAATAVCIPPGEGATAALVLHQAIFGLAKPAAAITEAPGFHPAAATWLAERAPFIRDHPWLADDRARELAAALLGAKRPVAVVGNRWLTSAHSLFQTVHLFEALALAGLGERLLVVTGESNSWGTSDVLQPTDEDRALLLDLLDPEGDGEFPAVLVFGDDLVARSPRPAALAGRLRRAGTCVVVDRFRTATTALADVVLPSAAFGELDGTVTSVFGTVQRWRRAVPPPGDGRPEREWAAGLARALGVDGWPTAPRDWLREIQRTDDLYGAFPVDTLYGDDAPFGVALIEPLRPGFSPVGNPPASERLEAFPLAIVYGAHPAVWSTGAMTAREELLRREVAAEHVCLSPQDAKDAGLRAGQGVTLATPHSKATLALRIDERLPAGVALVYAMPGGAGFQLSAFYRDWGGRTLDIQPVPARIERG